MQPLSVYIGGNYQLLPMFSNFFHKFLRKQERPGGRSYHTSILSCCKSLILKLSISLADVLKAKQFASKKADNSVDTSFCRFITTFFLSLIIYHAPKMLPVVEISILSISNSSIGKISAFSLDETAIPMISPSNTAMNKGRSPLFFF